MTSRTMTLRTRTSGTRTSRTRTTTRPHVLAVALLVMLGFATACDRPTKAGDEVATIEGRRSSDTKDGTDGDDDEPTEEERQDAMLAFAECMREHGIDMPDPETSAGGGVKIAVGAPGGPGGPSEDEMQKMDEANEACEPIMEDVFGEPEPMSPEEQARIRDEQLAFAKCMREHGIDMPDPEIDFDGGRTRIRVGGGNGGAARPIDPESGDFAAANEACESVLGEGRIGVASPAGASGSVGNSVGGSTNEDDE